MAYINGHKVITTVITKYLNVDDVYPLGAIYMSVNSTSPNTLFGGTWERIQDTFLLAAGSTYEAGETGGEATHVLTVNEMPSHNHQQTTVDGGGQTQGDSRNVIENTWTTIQNNYYTEITGNRGGGQAHNNMPPYLAVYIWKRTA